ncbi:hypothetical protein Mapa_005007 [Marchantia paleacea]|nr:hypothetical protein Mapa_005007 [Marchantia paleacea]
MTSLIAPLVPSSSASPSVGGGGGGGGGGEVEPLLEPLQQRSVNTGTGPELSSVKMQPWAGFLNNIYNGASNLANLLPTGTFLAFTAIAPIVTDNGTCDNPSELWLSMATTLFFAAFCFFSCFTDSFQAADGQVYYGIVTFSGLWTPQLPVALHPGDKEQYKLTFIDFIHALLSLAVFAACAMMTPNIRSCLYPKLSDDAVRTIPALVSFIASYVFTAFPSTRHGVGFPVSPASASLQTTTSKME